MLSKGQTVIVALSGGADSVALLSCLKDLQPEYGLGLLAAHVNHGIRGAEADRDEAFCKDLCEQLGVELKVLHADVPALCKETGASEETCGRKVRYGFFEALFADLQEQGLSEGKIRIATAHTAQDAVETFLFHLARGTGLTGLTGLPAVRGNIIRPLIDCSREEIEEYLLEKGLAHIEDSTNKDTAYARNRIRHNILPELEAVNPGAFQNVLRCMELLKQDEAHLQAEAEALLNSAKGEYGAYCASILAGGAPAVASRAVASILTEVIGQDLEQKHVAATLDLLRTGGQIQIPSGVYVRVRNNELTVLRQLPKPEPVSDFAVLGAEEVTLPIGTFTYRVYPNPNPGTRPDTHAATYANQLDYDKLSYPFTLRNRREGDNFSPAFRHLTKSLKTLFQEAGIPSEQRSGILLMESDNTLCWVEGIGPSEDARVTETTQTILEISLERKRERT